MGCYRPDCAIRSAAGPVRAHWLAIVPGDWYFNRLVNLMSSAAPPALSPSLKRRALIGSVWTLIGHGSGQLLRMGSNLILTRLLVPEMFGVMMLVHVFMCGLQMISDVGVGPSIIQNRRGDDPLFLNTAWTIQIVRGAILWGVSCLLAWPLAILYGVPALAWIVPVVGSTALIGGFNSMSLLTRARHISLGRLTMIDLSSQLAGIVTMISLALFYKSVWVLVAGGVCAAITKLTLSHMVLPGNASRLAWDREAVSALFRFGQWIFFATLFTFCWVYADRLLLGYFMTSAELGIYSVALALSQAVVSVVSILSDKVVLPFYARFGELGGGMAAKVQRVRRAFLPVSLLPVCAIAIWGPALIGLMYDSRYQGAGQMLRVLAVGSVLPVLTAPLNPLVLARGDSRRHAVLMGVRLVLTLLAMLTGGWLGGVTGLMIGYVVSSFLFYPIQVLLVFRPYGVWEPGLDAAATAACLGIITIGICAVG